MQVRVPLPEDEEALLPGPLAPLLVPACRPSLLVPLLVFLLLRDYHLKTNLETCLETNLDENEYVYDPAVPFLAPFSVSTAVLAYQLHCVCGCWTLWRRRAD